MIFSKGKIIWAAVSIHGHGSSALLCWWSGLLLAQLWASKSCLGCAGEHATLSCVWPHTISQLERASCSSAAAVVAALPSYMVQTATKTSSSSAVAVIVALGDDGALYLSFFALSETERNSWTQRVRKHIYAQVFVEPFLTASALEVPYYGFRSLVACFPTGYYFGNWDIHIC